jgi:hypothetical protein
VKTYGGTRAVTSVEFKIGHDGARPSKAISSAALTEMST